MSSINIDVFFSLAHYQYQNFITSLESIVLFLQINIGVVKLRDSGSVGSSKCVVYDNGKSTCR